MYAKAIWDNQIHMMNLNQIGTVDELKTLVRKIFKNVPSEFVLRIENGDRLIELSHNETILQLRQKNIKKIKLIVQQLPIRSEECLIQNNMQINQLEEKSIDIGQKVDQQCTNVKRESQENRQPQNVQQHLIPKEQKSDKQIVYQCRLCQASPIIGIVYRCSVCPNLNICQNCQPNYDHKHPLVKLRNQNQRKFKIFAILQSELPEVHHEIQKVEIVNEVNNDQIQADDIEQKKQKGQHNDQIIQPIKVIASSAHWILNKLSQFKRYYMGEFCNPENVVENENEQVAKKQQKQMSQIKLNQQRKNFEHNWGQIEASDEENECDKAEQIKKSGQ